MKRFVVGEPHRRNSLQWQVAKMGKFTLQQFSK